MIIGGLYLLGKNLTMPKSALDSAKICVCMFLDSRGKNLQMFQK